MIPKYLHYCWLSGDPFPAAIRECMATWSEFLPGWQWILWDKNRFDVESVPYVGDACKYKKWAFAADYVRLHALNEMGGLYLDSDVSLHGDISSFLAHRCMVPIEYHDDIVEAQGTLGRLDMHGRPLSSNLAVHGVGLQAAVMAAEPGHPFINDCLAWYKDKSFSVIDGQIQQQEIAPAIYARVAERYDYSYKNEDQYLREDFFVPSNHFFAGTKNARTPHSVAVHNCAGSWRAPPPSFLSRGLVKLGKLMRG